MNAETLDGLLTDKDVQRMFRRSKLTIIHWRQFEGMPHVVIPGDGRPALRYRLDALKAWAKETGRRIYPVRDGGR